MLSDLEASKKETVQEPGKYGSPKCTQEQQQETLLYQICSKPEIMSSIKIPAGIKKQHQTIGKTCASHKLMFSVTPLLQNLSGNFQTKQNYTPKEV